jgi:acetolactate synthase-1/2/3 large subunit
VVDIPKDVQFATGTYRAPAGDRTQELPAQAEGAISEIDPAVDLMAGGQAKPIFYTGGGVINSGRKPASCCANWSR